MASGSDDTSAQRRGAKIRLLFDRFADLPADDRARGLDEACAGDPALRRDVERLLAAHDRADRVLYAFEHPGAPPDGSPAEGEAGVLDPYRLSGRKISHYRVLERIGDGGMGVVYRAEDTRLGRNVALKFLPPSHSRDAEAKRRLIREAQAASALDHPNICTVHEIGESDDGSLFIAMAFCEGESLRERIARGPLAIDEALDLTRQIATGLVAVHGRGIIHRDIKPGNLIVSDDGVVRILDFGLARVPDVTVTRTGRTMGTVAYMSPEQAVGAEVDARTDLWSLGAVMYEMVTGQRPFRGGHEQSVIYSIVNEQPRAPATLRPDLPEPTERILLKLLAKDPESRHASARALLDDLDAIGDAREPPSLARGARRTRKASVRRRALLVGAALLLSGVLWGAVELVRTATDRQDVESPGVQLSGEPADARPTVAVLPFDNLSADPADLYFAEGVHEEIVARVARIAALKVISRTSVLPYGNHTSNVRTIADELGARYVVEGSVRRFEDRVVITARLIDAMTDDRLWGDSYERERQDLFGMQADIAGRIAAALRARLSPQERALVAAHPTDNAEAHDLYLRAGALRSLTAPDSMIGLLDRAVRLDPRFALAYVALATVHRTLYFFNVDPTPARLELAQQAIDRALELDPDLPEAHLGLGRLYYYGYRDYARALAEFEIARRDLPNESPLYVDLGFIHRRQGRFEEAAASFRAALERSPSSYAAALHLGLTHAMLGDLDRAETYVRRAMVAYPDNREAPVMLSILIYCRAMGRPDRARAVLTELDGPADQAVDHAWLEVFLTERRFDDAIRLLEARSWDMIRMQPWVRPRTLLLGRLYQWAGDSARAPVYFDSARVALEAELQTLPDDSRLHAALGRALAGLGRKEEAIREARRATELMPISTDAIDGRFRLEDLADVYANVGEPDRALEILDFLLSTPGPFSIQQLRLRAEWDPLRNAPGYATLLERYGG